MAKRLLRLLKIFTGTDSGGESELLQLEGRLERFVHFWVLVFRSFNRNRGFVRASSLAYTTLLAVIPLLAFIVSISNTLLKNVNDDQIYQVIASLAPHTTWSEDTNSSATATVIAESKEVVPDENSLSVSNEETAVSAPTNPPAATTATQKEVAHWLRDFVQKAQGTKLGVAGMLVFLFIAVMMLSRVEETFNDIWGVARGRDWLKRVPVYCTAIAFGPPLLLMAGSLASGEHFLSVKKFFEALPAGHFLSQLIPFVVLSFIFAFIYELMPNTKVSFSAALAGGAVGGTLWHLNNVFSFIYVSNTVQNSGIFGALGLVPVFMLGLYFSWVILLFGAQVAYAYQNRAAYLQDRLAENVNQRGREFVALRIMTLLGQRFNDGQKPASVLQLATELGVPSRLVQQVLRILAAAQLVVETGGVEIGYVPARPLESINAHHVLIALRSGAGRELPAMDAPALAEIYGEFARIEEAERVAAEKISLLALATHSPVRPALAAPAEAPLEKHLTDTLIVEEISKAAPENTSTAPEPAPLPAPRPELKPVEPPAESPTEEKNPVRETVQPEEHDFPL